MRSLSRSGVLMCGCVSVAACCCAFYQLIESFSCSICKIKSHHAHVSVLMILKVRIVLNMPMFRRQLLQTDGNRFIVFKDIEK